MIDWINVKEKCFADIEKLKGGGYVWSGNIDEPFLVAIKTNSGWFIEKVVLTDGIGMEAYTEEEGTAYCGYDMTDVSFWSEINTPVTP